MNKFFCDRCGKEIGEQKKVYAASLVWSTFDIGDSGYAKELCKECAAQVEKVLIVPEGGASCRIS